MIVETLYPRDLKTVVVELRKKYDLNITALKQLSNMPRIFIFLLFVFSLATFISAPWEEALGLTGVGFTIFLIALPITIKRSFAKHMAAYVFGSRRAGTVCD